MSTTPISSDTAILDVLRRGPALSIAELSELMGVTATAVRQRLNRLMGQGFVERQAAIAGRGRPSHRYSLTPSGKRQAGANFGDLAMALWREIRQIKDVEVRKGLLQRIAGQMVALYADQIHGSTTQEKMESLVRIFEKRQIPLSVEMGDDLPVLTALACPYHDLAEEDRTVCAMEKMLFAELLGEELRLTQCRLDGDSCCTFEVAATT